MTLKIEEEIRYIIYYKKGAKWLIKETFDDKVKAEDHVKLLKDRKD